jgi:hypothetical protein
MTAVTEEGFVYTWGNNDCGQLGDGTFGGNGLAPYQIKYTDKDFNLNNISVYYTNANGAVLNSLTGGDIKAVLKIINGTVKYTTGTVILSLYEKDGGCLKDVTILQQDFMPDGIVDVSLGLKVPQDAQNYYMQVMIWDNLINMNLLFQSENFQ